MKRTEDDLRRVLKEWSAERQISPTLEPSARWEIVKGFTSGGSVPDHESPGCYVFYDVDGTLWYVGTSSRLGNRPGGGYFYRDATPIGKHEAEYATLQTIKTATEKEARDLELYLWEKLRPPANKARPSGG